MQVKAALQFQVNDSVNAGAKTTNLQSKAPRSAEDAECK